MKRTLITGGAGFIGSHLSEALLNSGHEVVCADNFYTGTKDNTFGPCMHPNDGRVVSNFVVSALNGEAITIYGKGDQTRSFCYVDDLVRGLILLMENDSDLTGPVNLSNPVESTILELAHKIIDLSGSSSNIEYHPLPSDDGLEKTIAYFEDRLH